MTEPVALATTGRATQAAIAAAAMRDAIRLWPLLDSKRLTETFPSWLAAMRTLTRDYHAQSAIAAGRFYRLARAQAVSGPMPQSLIPSPALDDEWLSRAFGYAGPGTLSRDTARPNTALSTTLGTTARIVQEGGRSTILGAVERDPKAVGWYRVTDGDPCAFCALLASRPVIGGKGHLYRSKTSAAFAAHNDCGCTAAPMFSHTQELPEINQQAAEIYRSRGKGPALVAFRKSWAERDTAPQASPSR